MSNELEVFHQKQIDLEAASSQIVVLNNDQYERAGEFCKGVKLLSNSITEYFEPMVSKAFASWKELTAKRKEQVEPLEMIEKSVKNKMTVFHTERQEKIDRQQRELELKKRKEEEELARKIKEQERKGNEAKTEELKQKMADVQAKIVVPTIVQASAKGTIIKEIWKYRVRDISKVERKYLIENDDMLRKLATATRGKLEVKGIEFYSEKQMSMTTMRG